VQERAKGEPYDGLAKYFKFELLMSTHIPMQTVNLWLQIDLRVFFTKTQKQQSPQSASLIGDFVFCKNLI